MEALFHEPDLVEFRQVSSCGPNATSEKVRELKLSELEVDVVFLGAKWVEENLEQQVTMIRRYCYDPMYGSSLHADGLAQGSIFLAHQELLQKNGESFFEPYTEISVNGPSADTQIH